MSDAGLFSSSAFFKSGFTENSSETKTEESVKKDDENLKAETLLSNFDEGACGEPLKAQHLIIDFTPTEEDEDNTLMKKCCDFFEYINSREDLVKLRVEPNPAFEESTENSDSSPIITFDSSLSVLPPMLEKTAVSALEMVEKKDLIKRAFESKMVDSKCSLGIGSYSVDDRGIKKMVSICTCNAVCRRCKKAKRARRKKNRPASATTLDVINLCLNIDSWDEQHPRSMESPVGPPNLIRAELQRVPPVDSSTVPHLTSYFTSNFT